MRRRTVRLPTILTLTTILLGCGEPPAEPPPAVRPVKIVTVGEPDSSSTRDYPGTIKAVQDARQGFEVPGRIIEFLAKEGDQVEQDQVLARLDPRDYESQLRVAQANLNKAQADLERSLNIQRMNAGAIAEADIDRDRRAVEVTEAELAIAEKAVEDTELRAAFAGL